MNWVATHTVDVVHATEVDDYGDEVDASPGEYRADTAKAVPMSIVERSRDTVRLDDQIPGTVWGYTGRCLSTVPVAVGDRLKDTRSDMVWVVDGVSQPSNPLTDLGLTLALRRLT